MRPTPASGLPRVCIIGAGSSGIPLVKAMAERDIPFDCFEASAETGGNWYFRNPNGMSAAYESLHINTHARLMEYADYPMPADTPHYPGHRRIKAYFDDYVDHFGLRERICFATRVIDAKRRDDGSWQVTTEGRHAGTFDYDALIVANGHHWDPRWPDPEQYPGTFSGQQMHAHAYLTPNEPFEFTGKNVLVVGMGNSAMDIASELSRPGLAQNLYLSARHGAWVMPKYMLGKPMSELARLPHWIPWQVGSVLTRLLLWLSVGAPQKYGLQKPDHRPLQAHPTISSDFLHRVGSGDILPRAGIERFDGATVRFTDGREEAIDIIIWATGYKVSFPFFDPDLIDARGNDLPRWEYMRLPDIPNLFFVGLYQPLGAIMPFAEKQAKIIGDHLLGRLHFPDAATMRRAISAERNAMRKRYMHSPRHTMEVDNEAFHHRLDRLRKQGERRARDNGYTLPVTPRTLADPAEAPTWASANATS